jgi:membrane-bound lytic murein transglycosylase D
MEGDGGVTTMTRKERTDHILSDTTSVAPAGVQGTMVSGKYSASVIAQTLGMDFASFNKLNPYFDKLLSQNSYYELRLPADKMQAFAESRNIILEQSVKSMLNVASR